MQLTGRSLQACQHDPSVALHPMICILLRRLFLFSQQIVELPGEAPRIIRLHSAHSGADAGVLRTLSTTEPALVVRPSTGELLFLFATDAARDAVYEALVADAARARDQRTAAAAAG